jgi:cell division protein FtsL
MRNDPYRKFSRLTVAALTGHTKVAVTIAVYSVVALLLLAYVSVQIYAGVLRQEIALLEQQRVETKEALNKLTGEFVSLSSRDRVIEYCENKLGMVRLDGENFEVLAVRKDAAEPIAPLALTETQDAIPSAARYTYRQTKENAGQ